MHRQFATFSDTIVSNFRAIQVNILTGGFSFKDNLVFCHLNSFNRIVFTAEAPVGLVLADLTEQPGGGRLGNQDSPSSSSREGLTPPPTLRSDVLPPPLWTQQQHRSCRASSFPEQITDSRRRSETLFSHGRQRRLGKPPHQEL